MLNCSFPQVHFGVMMFRYEMDRDHQELAADFVRLPASDSLAQGSASGRPVHGIREGTG
jgi:hypothetical protein